MRNGLHRLVWRLRVVAGVVPDMHWRTQEACLQWIRTVIETCFTDLPHEYWYDLFGLGVLKPIDTMANAGSDLWMKRGLSVRSSWRYWFVHACVRVHVLSPCGKLCLSHHTTSTNRKAQQQGCCSVGSPVPAHSKWLTPFHRSSRAGVVMLHVMWPSVAHLCSTDRHPQPCTGGPTHESIVLHPRQHCEGSCPRKSNRARRQLRYGKQLPVCVCDSCLTSVTKQARCPKPWIGALWRSRSISLHP